MTIIIKAPSPAVIRKTRESAGLTQLQAAKLAGFGSSVRVSEIETGASKMPAIRWTLMLLALGKHPHYTLGERV